MSEDRETEIRRAEADYERAMARVHAAGKDAPGRAGGGIEANYGQTYQRLVRLGARPQLKLKFRGRK